MAILFQTKCVRKRGMSMRSIIAALVMASTTHLALAQTQRTPPSAYPTLPTLPSAFATAPLNPCYGRSFGRDFGFFGRPYGVRRYSWSYNPTSPCYSGTPYPTYSALEPRQYPTPRSAGFPGAASLSEEEAKSRIETKGYLEVSRLEKDKRGIWRGKASLGDGRSVDVILDLDGNIYSELSSLYIRIERAPVRRHPRRQVR
jgi:hypothetical protein